jgi:hypothetical protein
MANFFDTLIPGDPNNFFSLTEYIQSHSPAQMLADIRASKFDPNYLPDLGDMVKMFLKEEGKPYAKLLYAEGIRQLESAPELLIPDTNLFFAKRNFCVCCMPNEPGEAFSVMSKTPELITADPALATFVAARLVEERRFQEANVLLTRIDQVPLEELLKKLEEFGINFDVIESLRAKIRVQLGSRKMGDLEWLIHPDAGRPPVGLLNMEMDELTRHGITKEVLATIIAPFT